MTPPAGQRATFEENTGSDARAIVYGETLDIEYNTGQDVIIINDE